MKVYIYLFIFISQHMYSQSFPGGCTLSFTPMCMSLPELEIATKMLCEQQMNNATLWASIIQCHRPVDDDFLRHSGEALCPTPKRVEDPTDTSYPIEQVFFNICATVEANSTQRNDMDKCIIQGDKNKNIASHKNEVATLQSKWGKTVPCDIGMCVKKVLAQM